MTVEMIAPSEKQIEYFKALVAGKQLTEDQRKALLESISFANRRSMSASIQFLIGLPWTPRVVEPKTVVVESKIEVAQGNYAIVGADHVLKFYEVKVPKRGNWVGYTFVSEVSSDNRLSVRNKEQRNSILTEIAKDALGALKRYGQEIGECGHCKKQLTDAESRQFGIGPVCRKKLGV